MVGNKYGKAWELDLLRNIHGGHLACLISLIARWRSVANSPSARRPGQPAGRRSTKFPRRVHSIWRRRATGSSRSPSAATLLKGARHPNAGKVWANFLLSKEAQQAEADLPGGGPLRYDVKVAAPELALHMNSPMFGDAPPPERFIIDQDCSNSVPKLLQEAGVTWAK